jgi:WhiB family transcriptional regulator, redox-sensing transcriptional regulator
VKRPGPKPARLLSTRPATIDAEQYGWKLHAACRDTRNPEAWFPNATRFRPDDVVYAEARATCNPCPVREECLRYALRTERGDRKSRSGMYGGLTPAERAALAKTMQEPK